MDGNFGQSGKFGRFGIKRAYAKPILSTHGSVQQLTEGGHKECHGPEVGSNLQFKPSPVGKSIFGDW